MMNGRHLSDRIKRLLLNILVISTIAISGCGGDNDVKLTVPNIVVILVDDLGYGDLDAYNTPNIDQIFTNGIEFSNFHTAPLCTPTRVSLLTGKYPQSFGTSFENALLLSRHLDVGLPNTTKTIFKSLNQNGYQTGIIGKWHLGWNDEFLPLNHGFDFWVGCKSGTIDYQSKVDYLGNYDWFKNGQTLEEDGYVTDLIAKHSSDFINENSQSKFALYVPFIAPHSPFQGPNDPAHRFVGGVGGVDWTPEGNVSNTSRAYREMIESLDNAVGRIISTLKANSLLEETVIVFLSDNGGVDEDFSSNRNLRGYKGEVFEGGIRVLCAIQWGDKIQPRESSESVHINDLPKTLASFANITFDGDGVDLSDLILREEKLMKRAIFTRRTFPSGLQHASISEGDWKYIIDRDQEEFLFDIANDVNESTNLKDVFPDTLEALSIKLSEWENTYQ